MRIISLAFLFGFAGAAVSGCGPVAHYTVTSPHALASANQAQSAASTCATCVGPARGADKYPVSALIACGPKLEHHDQATGPVTLGRNNTVVYRSALTGQMVKARGQCEVKFLPTSLARSEH